MALLVTADTALALVGAAMLLYYLIAVIHVLRSISARLANARLLLLVAASQTEPATELVAGVGRNVSTLHDLIIAVARSLELPLDAAR